MKLTTNKKTMCKGPCPYEPLAAAGGTLKDGTTYSFTTTGTATDLGQGTIEFGNVNDTLTLTFSQPVDFLLTSAVAPTARQTWHGLSETVSTKATSNGSAWCYDPGTQPGFILLQGQDAVTDPAGYGSAPDSNNDWGDLETYNVTELVIRAYVWDAFNFEARPITDKVDLPICEVTDDLCKKIKTLQLGANSSTETLTSLTANANNDTLTYTDEAGTANTIPITHLQQEICEGPFNTSNTRTGYWTGTNGSANTGVITANQASTIHYDYVSVGNGAVTSPDCVTDLNFTANMGNFYVRLRRMRSYMLLNYRLLVNGAVVYTRANAIYDYRDERHDTNPDVIKAVPVKIYKIGVVTDNRLSIPANSTVEVQAQWRYTTNGAQTSAYFWAQGGLYSQTTFNFIPRSIVTGKL